MLPDVQPGFCWGVNQNFFFCAKTAWFSPRAEQTNATLACHKRDIVTKYLVTVDGGGSPQPLGNFNDFAAKE